MSRSLIVGDPHITLQKLDDGRAFLQRLAALSTDMDQVILLGDLFHTFAVIRSEVMEAWCQFMQEVSCDVIAIVGNHDYAGQSGGSHALEPFKYLMGPHDTLVIDRYKVEDGIHYLPFMRSKDEFEKACRSIPAGSVLFCHQSFQGAEFGSGFLDPHGVDVECVSHLGSVISGHIHKRQAFANVWYPGVPFQHSFADAGYDCKVFEIDLSPKGYKIIKEHDLGMPKFEIITSGMSDLIEVLPKPNPTTSYKIVSKGTPQEISAFWKNPKVKEFRKKARRVVDALVPERGEVPNELFKQHRDSKEKLEAFIASRKWRSPTNDVLAAARAFFSQ